MTMTDGCEDVDNKRDGAAFIDAYRRQKQHQMMNEIPSLFNLRQQLSRKTGESKTSSQQPATIRRASGGIYTVSPAQQGPADGGRPPPPLARRPRVGACTPPTPTPVRAMTRTGQIITCSRHRPQSPTPLFSPGTWPSDASPSPVSWPRPLRPKGLVSQPYQPCEGQDLGGILTPRGPTILISTTDGHCLDRQRASSIVIAFLRGAGRRPHRWQGMTFS